MSSKKNQKKIPPIFKIFVEATLQTFKFLIDDFGFQHVSTEVHGYECSILYRRLPNIAIRIFYEPGGTPWLMITAKAGVGPAPNKSYEFNFNSLIKKRCPSENLSTFYISKKTQAEFSQFLNDVSVTLRKHFNDILEAKDGIGFSLKHEQS